MVWPEMCFGFVIVFGRLEIGFGNQLLHPDVDIWALSVCLWCLFRLDFISFWAQFSWRSVLPVLVMLWLAIEKRINQYAETSSDANFVFFYFSFHFPPTKAQGFGVSHQAVRQPFIFLLFVDHVPKSLS